MTKMCKRGFLGIFLLALLAAASPAWAAEKTEDQLIAELESPKEGTVTAALQKLEKQYPTSTKAFPAMKKLLKDPRAKVRRKAARVMGILHADVDQENIKDITAFFKSSDPREVIDGLIALRGLKGAEPAVPEMVALLKHSNNNVVRDSCRTLAVVANKDVIPSIEPLLNHPHPAVKKDAQDALFKLKAKP